MDWIKALAHHLWYVISPVGTITCLARVRGLLWNIVKSMPMSHLLPIHQHRLWKTSSSVISDKKKTSSASVSSSKNFAFRLSGLINVGQLRRFMRLIRNFMPLPCLPELYSQAHDIICDELAPEAILSETYLELEELLALLADPERFSTIADWYGRVGQRIRGNCSSPSFCPDSTIPSASCYTGLLILKV
ncbi:hypothetical protein DAPPUDRAFT_105471 [Daphnia pulex]|uniref:Uncharacterized protein n=1 Tax=Daphnia pulex TaxID=6669 RepID=E9GQX6_DAPPU|nr:hypothetical protein DAPPUDRAFT_105471 [Daphnia pulex]|eukprot:EFX78191.1 hypothetical protein DAPPUDRAFT_105471 [Daphnia pulex]